jgi:3-mercaptopropionate dioxygenase
MTLISPTQPGPAEPSAALAGLVSAVRSVLERHPDWNETAGLIADEVRDGLPGPDILTEAQRLGDPDRYCAHLLHSERDGGFSVLAVVWRPGQVTPIHDHVTWCVFGTMQGVEHEELFEVRNDASGDFLVQVGENDNPVGEVSGFAPPGDIHRVRNVGDETAISLHVYGTDIARVGSSVRREYDLPVGT